MAQVPLKKIRFFVTKDSAKGLVELLHDEGSVQLIDSTPNDALTVAEQENFTHRTRAATLESAVEFLSRYHKESDPFRAMFEGTKVVTNKKRALELAASYNTEEVLETVQSLQTRLVEVEAELKALDEEVRTIRSWERLDFPLNKVVGTEHTAVFPIHGSSRDLDALVQQFEKEVHVSTERIGEAALLVVAHRGAENMVREAVGTTEAEILTLPDREETPKEAIARIEDTRQSLESERGTIESNAQTLSEKELVSLKQIADSALWRETEIDTFASLPSSDSVSVFDAWVPKVVWDTLEARITSDFPTTAFEELALEEGEEPPTQIVNKGFANSFEFITRLYGVPGHTDLDPTPFLAFFFFIFFGLSLSDVGYGLILMTLTGTVLLRYKILGGMRQLLVTLFFGGLGATIAGMLYGGYFGVSAASIHPALAVLQTFDPIGNPMPVFYLALSMGVVQVMVGIILDIVRAAKNSDTLNGVLDNGPWLLMFLVLIAFTLSLSGILPAGISAFIASAWSYAAIGVAALISLSQMRKGTGIFDAILKGLLALYGGVNYFSDILSYSRLLALGLATSALGFSINLIAGIVGGNSLGIGTFFAVIVLIFGHTLNITLSSLGAFIHSSRLQYVEFFGKFLKGTGKPFVPFARKTKHTILLPEKPG